MLAVHPENAAEWPKRETFDALERCAAT